MKNLLAYLVLTTVFLTLLIPAFAQPPTATEKESAALLLQFKELAAQLPYISHNISLEDSGNENKEEVRKLRELVCKSDFLPASLLQSDSPCERSLACVVFGLSQRNDVLPQLVALDRDTAQGIRCLPSHYYEFRHDRSTRYKGDPSTVGNWARYALKRRLGVYSVDLHSMNDRPIFPDQKEFADWWAKVRHPSLLRSLWHTLYLRTFEWREPLEPLRQQLLKQRSPHKQALAIALIETRNDLKLRYRAQPNFPVPALIEEDEIVTLFQDISRDDRRELLAGSYDFGYGDDTVETSNHTVGYLVQRFMIQHADKLITADDARWLLERLERHPAHSGDTRLFKVVAQLATQNALPAHARWLQKFLENKLQQDILRREYSGPKVAWREEDIEFWAEKVLELLALYGQPAVPYVAEFFYGRGWKLPASQDHLGYLLMFQKQLVEQLAAKHAKLARPVLRAVIADAKFLELGWSSTRAIAEVADAHVLRPERKEPDAHPAVADVLKLQHALDAEAFDLATAAAAGKPPPDGEAVVRAVREFQAFLRTWTKQHP